MRVHLVDGTYELFRHYFGRRPTAPRAGEEIGAARGVVATRAAMLGGGRPTSGWPPTT